MIIFKRPADLQTHVQKLIADKRTVGFIPTMGALHSGHISLLEKCKSIADISVCSIFINPTQFNNPQDFKNYPVNKEHDIYLLEKNGCDILFLPGEDEIYPSGSLPRETFDLGYLEKVLEGRYRAGHFQGVCQVVKRLLELVMPGYLLAGQKDYQQCLVLKRLLQITGSKAEIIVCPTAREKDGLAMSSRNLRLTEKDRVLAPSIYEALTFIRQQLKPGDLTSLKKDAENFLLNRKFKVDYIEIADPDTLQPIHEWNGKDKLIILAAATINEIRLIDNLSYLDGLSTPG